MIDLKYIVVVKETLCRKVEVEAESKLKAEDKCRKMYQNCKIVLDAGDFEDVDSYVKEEEN